jgi:hypothetical protein
MIAQGSKSARQFLRWGNTAPGGMGRCSRIATARFFEHFLLARLVYNVTGRAYPQSAEPQALN